MNNKTVVIKRDISLETLELLHKKGLTGMRKKILLSIPLRFFQEGSELWWERANLEGMEDIKEGNVSKLYRNVDDLISDLRKGSLKKVEMFGNSGLI